MKEQPKTCKSCKYLESLPFADTYVCGNEYSCYADCDCNPDSDSCEAFEDKSED